MWGLGWHLTGEREYLPVPPYRLRRAVAQEDIYIYIYIYRERERERERERAGKEKESERARERERDSLCKSAAHRDKSREWNVSKQKWNLC